MKEDAQGVNFGIIRLMATLDTGREVKKRARIGRKYFSIPSLNNHFATSITLDAQRNFAYYDGDK